MLTNLFSSKKHNNLNSSFKIYNQLLLLTNDFVKSNTILIKNDFKTVFEIFSLFLIFYIKLNIDIKTTNYKVINQDLIDLFIKDLDFSLREQGIGDMSIGKYVKKFVKKFYFRLSFIDKNINNFDSIDSNKFIESLNIVNKKDISKFRNIILNEYKNLKFEFKS
tara:strand:- start:326 stop:817 length:492 start_codon:yes stop_codon:yes gene_type:complete